MNHHMVDLCGRVKVKKWLNFPLKSSPVNSDHLENV